MDDVSEGARASSVWAQRTEVAGWELTGSFVWLTPCSPGLVESCLKTRTLKSSRSRVFALASSCFCVYSVGVWTLSEAVGSQSLCQHREQWTFSQQQRQHENLHRFLLETISCLSRLKMEAWFCFHLWWRTVWRRTVNDSTPADWSRSGQLHPSAGPLSLHTC